MLSDMNIDFSQIKILCEKFQIIELSFFGSVLHEHFGPESDIDIILEFNKQANISLFDLGDIKNQLETMFGRPVDIVTKRSIEMSGNQLRKEEILGQAKVIYAKAS
jgi:predicted nucleotidyltransferase